MVLFNDLKAQYLSIKPEIDAAIQRVMNSGYYILGKELEAFEMEFAQYIGTKYCVGVASGTEAIALSLECLIENKGHVITSNVTAFPTITGIVQSGNTPVVVDVDINTGLLDINKIERELNTGWVRAIIPVHLYGQICDMLHIMNIATNFELEVIEDCAQAVGSIDKITGFRAGNFGICSAFSFYPTKNLGCYGDAGAIVTNNEAVYEKLKYLRNYGETKRYYHEYYGMNSRMDEIQAAILRVKLKYVDTWNAKRKALAAIYHSELKKFIKVVTTSGNYHLYVIQVPAKFRDDLRENLLKKGIQTLIHYPIPVNNQKAFWFQEDEKFPNSDAFTDTIISLPMYPELPEESVYEVCNAINLYFHE